MTLPVWLVALSIAALLVALLSALVILLDMLVKKRQMMPVMKASLLTIF